MEKTLKLGDKSVRITSNLSWLMVYRNQFGQDIIAVMMPAISGISDIAGGLLAELESNEITLKDIAGLVGFASDGYFATVFRKAEGMSATEYREQNSKRY